MVTVNRNSGTTGQAPDPADDGDDNDSDEDEDDEDEGAFELKIFFKLEGLDMEVPSPYQFLEDAARVTFHLQ